jgi:hypothetical protein
MLQNYNKILTKRSRIKFRSRLAQKKSAYFTHPDFSGAKIEKKKCANYASKYGISLTVDMNWLYFMPKISQFFSGSLHSPAGRSL